MNTKQAELLLAAVILSRSTAYIFSKAGLESLGVFTLLAARFITAFALLTLIFFGKIIRMKARDAAAGALIAAVFTAVMALELTALKTTDTSTVSFLENTAIVFVPFIEALLLRRLPPAAGLAGPALALGGVALLTLDGGVGLTAGELLCLCTALLYAVGIIVTDRFSHRSDALMIGVAQVGFTGLFALVLAFVFEQPRLPSGGTEWSCVLVLAVICTGFGFTLQPVAQSHTTSRRAGLMCALNPLFAALLGVAVRGETFTAQGVCGALLILASLFIPKILESAAARAKAQ